MTIRQASTTATDDEKAAAQTDLDAAQKQLTTDQADYAAKQCAGTPSTADAAACTRLDRALNKQKFEATDDVAISDAQAALDWAQEWNIRRTGVGTGQLLFEVNCARCHTKNWSIFDPTRTALKPEDLLGLPGGGGSLGFNLRDGATVRRFPDYRSPTGELIQHSGLLSQTQFVVNGDEGDPGAFMDRSVMEGDPHRIIEGMAIAGYAVGASQGYVYVRAEYPLAVKRLKRAIREAEKEGLLGLAIGGTTFNFRQIGRAHV